MQQDAAGYDPRDLWSIPFNAPLSPPYPIVYGDIRILTAVYRTDPAAVRRHLPVQLEPVSDLVMVQFYDMPDVQHLGHVHECNIMIGARVVDQPDIVGGFSTGLYISSDGGLAQGREVHGQPKKLAMTKLKTKGDLTVASLHRNGIRVMRATTPYKQTKSSVDEITAHMDFRNNLNAKVIRNIDGSLAVAQITSRILKNVNVTECYTGPLTMELAPNAQAPVYQLPVLEPVQAFEWHATFELQPGTVVVDLLA